MRIRLIRARLRLGKIISEMFCEEYWAERDLKTHIAVSQCLWPSWHVVRGKREGAGCVMPKVIEAKDTAIWKSISGRRHPHRSFMFIDDCTYGIDRIMAQRCVDCNPD
jgi:hypothetical protein